MMRILSKTFVSWMIRCKIVKKHIVLFVLFIIKESSRQVFCLQKIDNRQVGPICVVLAGKYPPHVLKPKWLGMMYLNDLFIANSLTVYILRCVTQPLSKSD